MVDVGVEDMSELDDKLYELLISVAKNWIENDGRPKHLLIDLENTIPEIKQAFAETGYVLIPQAQVGKLDGVEIMSINGKEVMTGQEWYDRFIKNADHEKVTWPDNASREVICAMVGQVYTEAAKKASNIDK